MTSKNGRLWYRIQRKYRLAALNVKQDSRDRIHIWEGGGLSQCDGNEDLAKVDWHAMFWRRIYGLSAPSNLRGLLCLQCVAAL